MILTDSYDGQFSFQELRNNHRNRNRISRRVPSREELLEERVNALEGEKLALQQTNDSLREQVESIQVDKSTLSLENGALQQQVDNLKKQVQTLKMKHKRQRTSSSLKQLMKPVKHCGLLSHKANVTWDEVPTSDPPCPVAGPSNDVGDCPPLSPFSWAS